MRKLALITGGTSGLGFGIAKALLADHDLALSYARDDEKAKSALNELRSMAPGEAKVRTFMKPLANEKDCVDLLAQVRAEMGDEPEVLVNSAGRLRDGLFLSVEFSEHVAMLMEHLVVPMALSRLCLKKMYRGKRGRIVNLSSITARRVKRGQVNYTAAKAGIEGFTRALALEVAHRGVTVNAIAPGLIATPMTQNLITEREASAGGLRSIIPAGFVGHPDDIGEVVAFLCSDKGRYITGQTLDVDGGRALGENG
jgi:NAD(P)-dependent dehydrogenase (short-subunit alcohol dehydrogenase family)